MSTTLNKITARAKQLRKKHPSMKWLDAVKKSSIELRKEGTIGRAPVRKVGAKKRRITKKAFHKKVGSYSEIVSMAKRNTRKKKKRIAAVKFIEKNETKKTPAKKVYRVIRKKSGQFKGMQKVLGISHTDKNLLANIEKAKSEIFHHEKRISELKEVSKNTKIASAKLSALRLVDKEKHIIRDKKKFISLMKKHL
jgi:hypothetical protein